MGKHKYFGHNKRILLINNLKSLLEHHDISYHKNELFSYSNSELKNLINFHRIILKNADNPNNSWYGSRRYYIQKPYNFIDSPSHHWYRTTYAKQFDY
tara:strand:+ start:626 stop:919 length:294 start_codon:yes stop_codon:yes gene_type:complete